jgi:hypothetical protein
MEGQLDSRDGLDALEKKNAPAPLPDLPACSLVPVTNIYIYIY